MNLLIFLFLGTLALIFAFFAWRWHQDARSLRTRYASIINIHAELTAAKDSLEQTRREQQEIASSSKRQRAQLSQDYDQARSTYEKLKNEISLLEENLEDISFGLYKPHFNFQTPDEYRAKLEALREDERQLIRGGRAAVCPVSWTVGGSGKEGARMAKQNEKLLLRAFNGEV